MVGKGALINQITLFFKLNFLVFFFPNDKGHPLLLG